MRAILTYGVCYSINGGVRRRMVRHNRATLSRDIVILIVYDYKNWKMDVCRVEKKEEKRLTETNVDIMSKLSKAPPLTALHWGLSKYLTAQHTRGTPLTDLHWGLSKYLTAQDTRGTPTLTKHSRTLARLGYLISLQQQSTIKVNCFFFMSLDFSW